MSNKIMEAKTDEELVYAVAEALSFSDAERDLLMEKYKKASKMADHAKDDDDDLIDPMSSVSEEEMKAEERAANKIMTAFRFTHPNDVATMIRLYDKNPNLILSAFSAVVKLIDSLKD